MVYDLRDNFLIQNLLDRKAKPLARKYLISFTSRTFRVTIKV